MLTVKDICDGSLPVEGLLGSRNSEGRSFVEGQVAALLKVPSRWYVWWNQEQQIITDGTSSARQNWRDSPHSNFVEAGGSAAMLWLSRCRSSSMVKSTSRVSIDGGSSAAHDDLQLEDGLVVSAQKGCFVITG
ncbi:hypothetical protein NL676_018214 [Syzygium grande]|nr:hypothetical protein NL676_018214 [Syzygium grande]